MPFDARTAKILAPGEHLTIEGCPGLRLEATATRRAWTYRYKSPASGLMKQVKIGEWPAMPLPAAMGKWSDLRAVRDDGRDPAAERRATRPRAIAAAAAAAGYTVRQVADDYLAGHVKRARKPRGAAEVARTFDTMLGAAGARQAATLTRSEAFDLLAEFQDTPVQAQKLRLELGAAWDYALDAGKLPEATPNWWRKIMRGRLRSKGKSVAGAKAGVTKRVLNEKEVGQVLRWLVNFSEIARDVLTLYLWTGTRGAEIVAMRGEELTEEADGLWWTVPKAKTKNARHDLATDLRVPLIGRAAEVARRRAKDRKGYLFPGEGPPHVNQESIGDAVRYHQPYSNVRPEHARERLPVTHWSPHDLRRTARTMLAGLGCPKEVGEAILGHMQPGVEGVYNLHGYDAERRLWLTKLSRRLEVLAKK